MQRLPVSVFRITIQSLTAPVEVTSDGKVIGTWTPGFGAALREPQATFDVSERPALGAAKTAERAEGSLGAIAAVQGVRGREVDWEGFGKSSPVPKPGKK